MGLVYSEITLKNVNDQVMAKNGRLADGNRLMYNTTGPLEIWWKDRRFVMEALIIPNGKDTLLGALPLEGLDLIVDPIKQELTGAHGEEMLYLV